jgi:serine/threonine protein phosphatase PrpC
MRGAALMGLSSNAGPSLSSRPTPPVSSQHNSSFARPEPEMCDAHRTARSAGIPSSRDYERSALPLGGASGGSNASYATRGLSTGGNNFGASAGSGYVTGLYSRDSERSALPVGGASGGGNASYANRGLSTGGATSVAGSGGGSRTRRELVRGNVGVAEDANLKCRPSMEDRSVVCNPLAPGGGVFLGVFDGHGGAGAADFAADVIQHNFANELKRAERKSLTIAEVLTNTYHETDSQIAMAGVSRSSGCTAVTAYVHVDSQGKRLLHVANAGDSRAVLCRNMVSRSGSASSNIKALTRDHKPSDPQELARIQAAGGDVARGRVMGILAVSRALGDHSLKDFVVSTPEVRTTELGSSDEGFILLACDGVFDVFSNEEAVSIIQNSYRERVQAAARSLGVQSLSVEQKSNVDMNIATVLAKNLVERAIQNGSRDNITCLVCLC